MALPPFFENEEIVLLKENLEVVGIDESVPLNDKDHLLIGKYIQIFNFIELNVRRSLFSVAAANGIAVKKEINPANLSDEFLRVLKCICNGEEFVDADRCLRDIELGRRYRNLMAHWAARKIADKDAYLFLSFDGRDIRKVLNKERDDESLVYAVIFEADVRGLMKRMANYEVWIAKNSAIWIG